MPFMSADTEVSRASAIFSKLAIVVSVRPVSIRQICDLLVPTINARVLCDKPLHCLLRRISRPRASIAFVGCLSILIHFLLPMKQYPFGKSLSCQPLKSSRNYSFRLGSSGLEVMSSVDCPRRPCTHLELNLYSGFRVLPVQVFTPLC